MPCPYWLALAPAVYNHVLNGILCKLGVYGFHIFACSNQTSTTAVLIYTIPSAMPACLPPANCIIQSNQDKLCIKSPVIPLLSSTLYLLPSTFYPLPSTLYLLPSIFYLLPLLLSIFYLLSSIFYLLSSISYLLSPISYLLSPISYLLSSIS
jgi:hypothetical protein